VTGGDAHDRYWLWWDVYFGVVAATVATATLVVDGHPLWRRLTAVGAVAAMALVHAVAEWRLVRRDSTLAVPLAHIALFAVAVAAAPFTTWLLFAIIPLIFQTVSLRRSIVLVVLVNLVKPAADAVTRPAMVGADLLIGLITTATGVWLGFWILRVIEQNSERGLLIEQLEESRADVARLSHEAGVAAERARLAGEIHDTLAQGFTSIITLLQAADPSLRDERIALAVTTAKENLAESRALIAALSPSALTAGSLPDSVRRQAARFEQETGLAATVRITGSPRVLPTAVEVVLLRAAQEALTNVRRHACAATAQILLAYDDAGVRLVVRDDGRGFEPGSPDGFGLAGMRARAAQVDGTLTVRSEGSAGTTIEVEVPA